MSLATAAELWRMSATELAEAIRTRQASSVEVVEAHLRRIEAVNPSINAVTVVLGEQALDEFQEEHLLIVAPICTDIPFEVGKDLTAAGVADIYRGMRMAMAVNTLGLPAVAIPVGIGNGLPQVMQVIGPRYREDLCLDAAAVIEERLGIITPIDPR